MDALIGRYDVLLTPTVPIPAFEIGRDAPVGSARPDWTSWTPYTYPFNMTQQPALSVPCGFTSAGLPTKKAPRRVRPASKDWRGGGGPPRAPPRPVFFLPRGGGGGGAGGGGGGGCRGRVGGVRSVAQEPVEQSYVKAAPILDQPDHFDAAFFGYSPAEASTMDPQHRLLLELAPKTDGQAILRAALRTGPVREFRRAEPSLGELFRDAIGEQQQQ